MQTTLDNQKQVDLSASQASQITSTIRSQMTEKATFLLAAELISRPDFPNRYALPKVYPPAFNNFGHQPLMDYELLLKVVWGVIENIKSAVTQRESDKSSWIAGSVITGIALFILGVVSGVTFLIAVAFIASIGIYNYGKGRIQKAIKKDVANVRAEAIKQLTSNNPDLGNYSVNGAVERELEKLGNGILGGDKTPVITIISDEQPFTGYGRLQAENLFICRPKDKNHNLTLSIDDLRKMVSKNITDKVLRLNIRETTFGEVVVVHGDSLCIDSKWLDEDKAPILWIDRNSLDNAHVIDSRASMRTYYAIQILFHQYMTAATFFVRLFQAGNSASCQIAVTTLGPPAIDEDYLHSKLRKHEIEEEEGEEKTDFSKATVRKDDIEAKAEAEAVNFLRLVRIYGRSSERFQSDLSPEEIKKLNISLEKDAKGDEYEKEYQKIIKQSAVWPGRYYKPSLNWRENNSLTFTTDFFGRSEAIASVRTLYDQISRTVLDTLDTQGFDISEYRDSEGNYFINADKIDQIVVGKKIHMSEHKESRGESPKSDVSGAQ